MPHPQPDASQDSWDSFAQVADSTKSQIEPIVGRAADVRNKVRTGFRPLNVADITVLPQDEIQNGLRDLDPDSEGYQALPELVLGHEATGQQVVIDAETVASDQVENSNIPTLPAPPALA